MIWFTADTHFNHFNIINYCSRPFSSIKEMNECLISRWNEKVKEEDLVYHLGDFGMFRYKEAHPSYAEMSSEAELNERLNGSKILIRGNHDSLSTVQRLESFHWTVMQTLSFEMEEIIFHLYHYPIEDWYKKYQGSVHLHGHTHGTSRELPHRLDVGVDVHHFYPVSLDEILSWVKTSNQLTGFLL